jgi:tetratricopeptide (TPR) repeat protein
MNSISVDKKKSRRVSRRAMATCVVMLLALIPPAVVWVNKGRQIPDAERIYRIGQAAMAEGDVANVQVAAEALEGIPEAAIYASLLQGYVLLRSGRLSDAMGVLHEASDDPRTGAVANALAGEALYQNRQYGDAIRALTTATRLDPSLTDAHRRLAAILYDLGAMDRAVAELESVSRLAPNDARPHRLMGLIHKDMESFERAIEEYREALRRDPLLAGQDDVLFEFATCLLKTRQHEELDELLRQCPRSADFLVVKAESLFEQGQAEEARAVVDEALAMAPNHLEALILLGSIQLESAAVAESVETFRRAIEVDPYEFLVRHKLSQAHARLGQTDLARQQSDEANRLRNLRSRFAELHVRASSDARDANLRFELGQTAIELGLHDLAATWFAAAISLDPNHQAAQKALQSLMERDAKPAATPVPDAAK